MRKPNLQFDVLKNRRAKLAERTQGSTVIIGAVPETLRNSDVENPFRQDSSIYYFTGFEEPGSVFVFLPGKTPEYVMFVRQKDELAETWTGFRYGVAGTQKEFGVDQVYDISQFAEEMPKLLKNVDRVYYSFMKNHHTDKMMHQILEQVRLNRGRSGLGVLPVFDPLEVVGEIRLFKQPEEVKAMRKAAVISSKAHMEAMRFTKPGKTERQVEGALTFVYMNENSHRQGYGAIVGTGDNATVLHYRFNDATIHDGDLVLVDSGTEWDYYTADITRCFPANGKFSEPQKTLYNHVLQCQKKLVAMSKPGFVYSDLQKHAIEMLTESMLDMGFFKGKSKAEVIEQGLYKKYYPHNIGHFLGLDVHDIGPYLMNGKSRQLEEGMFFTIEPGIYVPAKDTEAPEQYRGIGVRIEDNILITATGNENLTEMAPKEVLEIETIMKEKSFLG